MVLGDGGDPPGQPDGGLWTADDLDLLPREGARYSEAERFADRLFAREAAGVAFRGVRAGIRSTPAPPQ